MDIAYAFVIIRLGKLLSEQKNTQIKFTGLQLML